MKIPEDWDEPSAENEALCKKFEYGEYTGLQKRIIPYRAFCPKADPNEKLPIVLYLHGADAIGRDNEIQLSIHDIGTTFVRDDWQSIHPCHVLAPQYRRSMHWAREDMPEYLHEFLESYMDDCDASRDKSGVDRSRIYIYGYSAGGIGTLRNIMTYPDFFAAAIVICGAITGDDLTPLKDTPMWLFHAVDDTIVPYSDHLFVPSENSYHGSHSIYEKLHPLMGEEIRYTEYEKGFMKKQYGINPHCTWVPAAECRQAHEWMFSHSR